MSTNWWCCYKWLCSGLLVNSKTCKSRVCTIDIIMQHVRLLGNRLYSFIWYFDLRLLLLMGWIRKGRIGCESHVIFPITLPASIKKRLPCPASIVQNEASLSSPSRIELVSVTPYLHTHSVVHTMVYIIGNCFRGLVVHNYFHIIFPKTLFTVLHYHGLLGLVSKHMCPWIRRNVAFKLPDSYFSERVLLNEHTVFVNTFMCEGFGAQTIDIF